LGDQRFRLKPVPKRQHLLFNMLNFLYFRRSDYSRGFSLESSPLFMFIIVPYVLFSEIYFFGQKRYFVTIEKQIVSVLALENRTNVLYISNLAVSPFYRRMGMATYLLGFAVGLARQHDKNALELSVNKANTPALRLYAKQGFRKEGERYSSYVLRKDVKGAS